VLAGHGGAHEMIREAWYAAGWSHELGGGAPLGRKILGQELALFRDGAGRAHAVDAACPHRGASLAAGRVVNGHLECPYHGWQFATSGQCVRIPSQPRSAKIPERACVRRHHLVEAQGVLWFWGGASAPKSPPPNYDFWDPGPAKRSFARACLFSASFVQVAEQSIDFTHTPFAHRVSLGGSQPVGAVRFEAELDPDGRGFGWTDKSPPASGKGVIRGHIQRRLLGIDAVLRRFRFDLGGVAHLRVDHANGGWDVTVFNMTPADAENTWFFAETVRTHSKDPVSELMHQKWLDRVIAEDSYIAASMLVKESGLELPTLSVGADSVTLVFRKLYRRWALAESPGMHRRARSETSGGPEQT
jgi:phenylpropionate dioxygenase-like ring-hydroxylating dioxygenase large terminal subunit